MTIVLNSLGRKAFHCYCSTLPACELLELHNKCLKAKGEGKNPVTNEKQLLIIEAVLEEREGLSIPPSREPLSMDTITTYKEVLEQQSTEDLFAMQQSAEQEIKRMFNHPKAVEAANNRLSVIQEVLAARWEAEEADVLTAAVTPEEVDRRLSEMGFDPEAVGLRGQQLVERLLEKRKASSGRPGWTDYPEGVMAVGNPDLFTPEEQARLNEIHTRNTYPPLPSWVQWAVTVTACLGMGFCVGYLVRAWGF